MNTEVAVGVRMTALRRLARVVTLTVVLIAVAHQACAQSTCEATEHGMRVIGPIMWLYSPRFWRSVPGGRFTLRTARTMTSEWLCDRHQGAGRQHARWRWRTRVSAGCPTGHG